VPGRTVVIFGAGATKACGGPLTSEILPEVLARAEDLERGDYLGRVERFLVDNFSLPPPAMRQADHFPPLPLVLSLVDMAIDRGDSFGPNWEPGELRRVRKGLEYAVFALLEDRLRRIKQHYSRFLRALYAAGPESVTLISLNYDIIADNALPRVAEQRNLFALPDYRCDIATKTYQQVKKFGTLLKLHGSLNWLYCPNCYRLDLGVAQSGRRTVKVLDQLYVPRFGLERQYTEGSPCLECGTWVLPVLITPTHLKDYRNSHIARVWYEAARALRAAQRAIFVGYSLPDDDVEVIYLLKRGLSKLAKDDPRGITVVEYVPDGNRIGLAEHPVGRRYRALLGDQIEWRTEGFAAWIDEAATSGFEPVQTASA
jgi:hypothetical protein